MIPDTKLLVRTNPKLTSNLKLVVSLDGLIYMDSIKAKKELTGTVYSNVKLKHDGVYGQDIRKFYLNGGLPSTITHYLAPQYSDLIIHQNYSAQYENLYTYGVTRNFDGLFEEQFKLFAPLWIRNRKIPAKFVVFRIPGPKHMEQPRNPEHLTLGIQYRVIGVNTTVSYGANQYVNNDTFTANAEDGDHYLINGDGYVVMDDPNFEINDLVGNIKQHIIHKSQIVHIFDLSEASVIGQYLRKHLNDSAYTEEPIYVDFEGQNIKYTGISIQTGSICQKIEGTPKFFESEYSVTNLDRHISQGFERNSLVICNLINLEFLFNDSDYENSFNRYYGLYVDDLDLADFSCDSGAMFSKHGLYPDIYADKSMVPNNHSRQYNSDIKVCIDTSSITGYFPGYQDIGQKASYYYIKDVKNEIWKINNTKSIDSLYIETKSFDISRLSGFNDSINVKADKLEDNGISYAIIRVNGEMSFGYRIAIQYNNRVYGTIVGDHLPDYVGEYQEADNLGYYFYPYGTTAQIAEAMAKAIKYVIGDIPIFVTTNDNYVIIKSGITGDVSEFAVNMTSGDDTKISVLYNQMSGGTALSSVRAKVDKDLISHINNSFYIKTQNGYSKIKDIVYYADEPVFNSEGFANQYNGFDNYKVISIPEQNGLIEFKTGAIKLFDRASLKFGVFDVYDVSDFDYETDISSYSIAYESEYSKYFNVKQIISGHQYKLFKADGDSNPMLKYEGITYDLTNPDFVGNLDTDYEIIRGNPVVIDKLYEDDEEVLGFQGFNAFESQPLNIDTLKLQNKSKIFLNQSGTEYTRLKENKLPNNVMDSKLIPYITKWVMGSDCRDNLYRLNISKSFGSNNFTSSFIDATNNAFKFTHEWAYISGYPESSDITDLKTFNYYTFKPFDQDRFLADPTYFDHYFIPSKFVHVDGYIVDIPPYTRYSIVKKVSAIAYEVFFKGYKVRFTSNEDLTDYKYSSVINIKKSSLSYTDKQLYSRFLVNSSNKTIVLVIDVILDDYKILPDLNLPFPYGEYSYLYMMNSLKRYESGNYTYGIEFNYPIIRRPIKDQDDNLVESFRGIMMHLTIDDSGNYGITELKFKEEDAWSIYNMTKNGAYGRLIALNDNGLLLMTNAMQILLGAFIVRSDFTDSTILKKIDKGVNLKSSGLLYMNHPVYDFEDVFNPVDVLPFIKGESLIWFHQDGGYNSYVGLRSYLSFANMHDVVNKGIDIISDIGIQAIKIIKNQTINLKQELYIEESKAIIPGLSEESVDQIVLKERESKDILYRYSGLYAPKFKDVWKFEGYMNSSLIGGVTGLIQNTPNNFMDRDLVTFIYDGTNWVVNMDGVIELVDQVDDIMIKIQPDSDILYHTKTELIRYDETGYLNLYCHKISDSVILKSTNPIYESIGEIGIWKKSDHSIFLSNWYPNIYNQFVDKLTSNQIHGLANIEESKFFLATNVLVLEDIVTIRLGDNCVITDDGSKIMISIDKSKLLSDYLSDNLKTNLNNYMSDYYINSQDFVYEYTKLNVSKAYKISRIKIYGKVEGDTTSITTEPLSNLLDRGFIELGLKYEESGDFINVTYFKSNRLPYSLSLTLALKLK